MSSRRSMTRDIHESIRLLLGKNVKILLKAPVKLELKGGDKTENRILVFTAHRLFLMTAKVPARIDHHFHYLDLRGVESRRHSHVAFTFQTSSGGHGSDKKTNTYSFRWVGERELGIRHIDNKTRSIRNSYSDPSSTPLSPGPTPSPPPAVGTGRWTRCCRCCSRPWPESFRECPWSV